MYPYTVHPCLERLDVLREPDLRPFKGRIEWNVWKWLDIRFVSDGARKVEGRKMTVDCVAVKLCLTLKLRMPSVLGNGVLIE